jgi:hypothetical protein
MLRGYSYDRCTGGQRNSGVWIDKTETGHQDVAGRVSLLRVFVIVYATALGLCFISISNGITSPYGTIDDQMREIQIRTLVSPSGNWWDLEIPIISMPEIYVSPWSRLVDLPYVLVARVLNPFLGLDGALAVSFQLWPPILLGLYSLLAASVFRRMMGGTVRDYVLLVASVVLMIGAIWEFLPGRIDHHNFQLVALMGVLAGLARWNRWGGVLVGLGSLLSVAIALEGLPFVVLTFLTLTLLFVKGEESVLPVLRSAALVILVFSVPLALVLLGWRALPSTQCDAFSAPYVLLLLGSGALLVAASMFLYATRWWLKLVFLAAGGASLLALVVILFPECLGGPYWMIDPLSHRLWLDRVLQEYSVLYFAREKQLQLVILLSLLSCVSIAAILPVSKMVARGYRAEAAVGLVALASLLLTLLLIRYIRFPFAFVPLFLPVAHHYLASFPNISKKAKVFVVVGTTGVVSTAVGGMLFVPTAYKTYDAVDIMMLDECDGGSFGSLETYGKGRIVAPLGLGLVLAGKLPSGFSVSAVPFHRASPGIRRMFQAFISTDSETRRQALAPFDYVAVCRFPAQAEPGAAPLYDALSTGKDWPGLVRLETGPANPFQLFRIDHANLR